MWYENLIAESVRSCRIHILLFHMTIGVMYTLRIVEPSGISYLANPNWIFDRRYKHSWANRMKIMPRSMLLWLQRYHVIQQYGGVFFDTFGHDGKMVAIIEGSNDGRNWYEYAYKYHVQDTREPPQFFAPLFPRLDHMIFYETNQISFNKINPMSPLFMQNPPGFVFLQLIQRLLENEPAVTKLLGTKTCSKSPAISGFLRSNTNLQTRMRQPISTTNAHD